MLSTSVGRVAALSLTLLVLSVMGSVSQAASPDVQAAMLKAADNQASGAYVRDRFLQRVKKPFNGSGKKAIIVGDSYAQDFTNVVLEHQALAGYQLSTRYIPSRCQMYLGSENVTQFVQASDRALCASSDTLAQAKAQIQQADVVFLVANWKAWSAQRLPTSIQNLELRPGQTLRVIGRKSFGPIKVRQYMRQSDAELKQLRNPVDAHQVKINNLMKRNLSSAIFVDQQQVLCGSPNTCPVFTPNLRLISFDGSHFTRDGARWAGQRLFQHSLLRNL